MEKIRLYFQIYLALALIFIATVDASANDGKADDSNVNKSKAFQEVLQENMLLTPAQIEQIKRMQEEREEVIAGRPANVIIRTVNLDVQPGMTPPIITTLPGYSVSITIIDQTGSPWPVKDATPGNPKVFHVPEPKDKKNPTNIITVSCKLDRGHSNLTIELLDMDMPIMFPLQIART